MGRRHTSGFEILGFDRDPAPGDPDRTETLAKRYQDIADEAQVAANVLRSGGSIDTGRGDTIKALKHLLKELPGKLQATVDSFGEAAEAYRGFARSLRSVQEDLDRAMDRAEPVAATAGQARPATPAADASDDAKAAARQQSQAIDQANSELQAAKAIAVEAQVAYEGAVARARSTVDEASSRAIKPRGIATLIANFFADHPIIQILLGLLIAAVAIFFPLVGLLLGAASLVLTTTIDVINGDLSAGTLVIGLLSLIPGAKVFGLVGKGGEAAGIGSKAAGTATKSSVGRLLEKIKVTSPRVVASVEFGTSFVAQTGATTLEQVLVQVGDNALHHRKANAGITALNTIGVGVAGGAVGAIGGRFTKSIGNRAVPSKDDPPPVPSKDDPPPVPSKDDPPPVPSKDDPPPVPSKDDPPPVPSKDDPPAESKPNDGESSDAEDAQKRLVAAAAVGGAKSAAVESLNGEEPSAADVAEGAAFGASVQKFSDSSTPGAAFDGIKKKVIPGRSKG